GDANLHWSAFAARRRNAVSEAKRVSAANSRNGAANAKRIARRANYLAKLHQCLIPVARRVRREQLLRGVRQGAPTTRLAQIAAHSPKTRKHAGHIAIEHGERYIVGNAQHSRRRVVADARQRERSIRRAREFAGVFRYDFLRRALQVARPRIIAKSRPKPKHLVNAS